MMYRIYCGDAEQHRVDAASEAQAISKWLDLMSYDFIEQAAVENFCKPQQIRAMKLVRL